MFIWEPHGCRPSLLGDGSQLLPLERLNDSGDVHGGLVKTHTPFSRYIAWPGQHKGSSAALWGKEAPLRSH